MKPRISAHLRLPEKKVPTRNGRLMREKPSPRLPSRMDVIATVAMNPQRTRKPSEAGNPLDIGQSRSFCCLLDRARRVDQANMGKRLRKVAQRGAAVGIDFLREQAKIVGKREDVLEQASCPSDVAAAGEVVCCPKVADAKCAFPAAEWI